MSAERDIVAHAHSSAASSAGALAGYLQRSCGHVCLDERVIAQGYRFYPWMSDDIPHFFNKRFGSGTLNLAITLQGGMGVEGEEDPFDGCESHAEARRIIARDDYVTSLWTARVTVGIDYRSVSDIAAPAFIAKHPAAFTLIADELVAMGIVAAGACPLCANIDE